jgi:hypothetical protein
MHMGFPLVSRVRALFVEPRRELPRAIAEAGDVRSVLLRTILPLAAIGALARLLAEGLLGVYAAPRAQLFGMTIGGGYLRNPGRASLDALLWCALTVGAWYLLARVLGRLAPRHRGRDDADAARKLAAIVLTPLWLAGVAALFDSIPYLAFVEPLAAVAGLAYGVLLGIWALPFLLGTPEAEAPMHMLTALAIGLGPFAVVWVLAAFLFPFVHR